MKTDILIHVVLDESGSMATVQKPTVEGFNRFIGEQKEFKDGEASVSLTKFNTKVTSVYHNIPIYSVQPLSYVRDTWTRMAENLGNNNYNPNGGTALNDAVVSAIRQTENDQLKTDGNPKVLIVIITDGQENSSLEFNYQQVAKLIAQKENQGWAFLFLGADQDAWANAGQYGISVKSAVNYKGVETMEMYSSVSNTVTNFRSGTVAAASLGEFTQDDLDNK